MTRRDWKPRRERRRTVDTVVRTHLAVITGVDNTADGVSVRREIELVKASLLYADTVEVLSLGSEMVRNLHSFAAGEPVNIWALMLSLAKRVISNAEEAALGTGLLERHLPAFPGAPMDELLELRRDLDEPLGRYRRKVSSLRSELQTGPFDENINAEVEAIWRLNIAPEIADIRKAMADHGLVREFIKAAGGDITSLVKGTLGAGIGVITANAFDLGTTISAGITAGGAIGPPAVGAFIARYERRSEARANDLYYLYEIDRRLS